MRDERNSARIKNIFNLQSIWLKLKLNLQFIQLLFLQKTKKIRRSTSYFLSLSFIEKKDKITDWITHKAQKEEEYRTYFCWLPVAFGLGIYLYFSMNEELNFWIAPLFLLSICILMLKTKEKLRRFFISIIFVIMGFAAGSIRTYLISSPMLDRNITTQIQGFVEEVEQTNNRQRVLLRLTKMQEIKQELIPYRVKLGVFDEPIVKAGDYISLHARMFPPSEVALPGGYDFRREAFFRSIGATGYTIGSTEIITPPLPCAA